MEVTREMVISNLEWILNDIEENGSYQKEFYPGIIRDAIKILKGFEQEYMKHYMQGRHDEAGLRDGTVMRAFSPD